MNAIKRPPLGVLDKKFYDKFLRDEIEWVGGISIEAKKKLRFEQLKGAIARYLSENYTIDPAWVEEFNQLQKELFPENQIREFKL